jgi:hypothetical protein
MYTDAIRDLDMESTKFSILKVKKCSSMQKNRIDLLLCIYICINTSDMLPRVILGLAMKTNRENNNNNKDNRNKSVGEFTLI